MVQRTQLRALLVGKRTFLAIVVIVCAGCSDTNENPDPHAYCGSENIRQINVNLAAVTTDDDSGLPMRPSPFGGYDGSPLVPVDRNIGAFYQVSAIHAVRYPLGWGCDMSLGNVFRDPDADVESADSYQDEAIDEIAKSLVPYSVLPVWQAAWDIGGVDRCTSKNGGLGVAVEPISDVRKWADVAARQAFELNSLIRRYYNEEMIGGLRAAGWMPGYVEVYPDPTGAGGYKGLPISPVASAYKAFFQNLTTLTTSGQNEDIRAIGIISPGIRISELSEIADPDSAMMGFISYLKDYPTYLPDLFSIKPMVDSLPRLIAIADRIRYALDSEGLDAVPLACIGTTMTADAWASVASTYSTAEERSAWFGAFITSAYIRLQGKVHTLFPGRWSFVDPSGEFNGDDLFQAADGSGLPALFMQGATSWFAWRGSELIDVENEPLYSGDGASTDSPMAQTASMSVIASKLANGGYQFLVASLSPLMTGRKDFPIQYSLNISGLPVDTTGWELKVTYTDASTKSRTYGKLETISALSNGVLQIPGCLMTPAVHLIVYQPVESE